MSLFHSPSIITSGLVLCLDAANRKSYPGSGTTWTDLSGRGNNGTLTNGPTYSSANGGSIVFDGVNDVVRVTNNFIPADSSLTVSAWTKITSGLAIVDTWNDSVSWDGWAIWADGAGNTFRLQLLKQYSPQINGVVYSVSSWTVGTWVNVVGTYNGTQLAIYINGKLDASANYSGGYDLGQANIGIGARQSSSGASNCSVAQVSIYNRALTAAEIQQNFNALRGRFGI